MKILAVVKLVPDSRASITVKPDGSGIETKGVKLVCNPFDEYAVEQAVRLRESRSDVEEVVVATVGPPGANLVLRTALAMGADRAVHIAGDAHPVHDDMFAARALSMWILQAKDDFDIVFCGKQTIDTDAPDVGPAIAEFLGRTHVGAITQMDLADDARTVRVHRRTEGAEDVFELALPVLLTCDRGLNEPRYVSLPNIMKARKKPLETLTTDQLSGVGEWVQRTKFVGLSPPLPRERCRIVEGEPEAMSRDLVRLLREEAKVI